MEELKKSIKRLEQKIDNNAVSIIQNMNKLHNHEDKINANTEKIQQNSFALDILRDIKQDNVNLAVSNKRFYKLLILVLVLWFITIGYLVYVLNDIGVTETTQEITDVNTIGGNVVNGDMYGED